ncbi:MAG: hypothetical protein IPG69_14480 [Flavobacteriales bacterium]|nr:hypothetical protein [Flavobacteriales bacterium]
MLNDNHAFNTMNYLEFVSDRYVSLQLEHHFEGLLLNKVPWLRRLKLREFLLARATTEPGARPTARALPARRRDAHAG